MIQIEIDKGSGFCFGVTTAINKAEEELANDRTLYCLGDIVHNGIECERLRQMGLVTINHHDLYNLKHVKVLLRAHGEPPQTYQIAKNNNIEIIDTTCPVVLQLQKRIKKQYDNCPEAQIVIFGKNGHAEVLGLVGQTNNQAIVVENIEDVCRLASTHRPPNRSTSYIGLLNTSRSISHRELHSRVSILSAVKFPIVWPISPHLPLGTT